VWLIGLAPAASAGRQVFELRRQSGSELLYRHRRDAAVRFTIHEFPLCFKGGTIYIVQNRAARNPWTQLSTGIDAFRVRLRIGMEVSVIQRREVSMAAMGATLLLARSGHRAVAVTPGDGYPLRLVFRQHLRLRGLGFAVASRWTAAPVRRRLGRRSRPASCRRAMALGSGESWGCG
jgi:hypothetical protein